MNKGIQWIPLNLPYNSYNDSINSFTGLGLNKPGVQIRLTNGKEYLIGDINTLAGTCDDCPQFDSNEIISAYRVVFCNQKKEKDEYFGRKCIVLKCEGINHLDANEGCVCSLIGKTVTLDKKYISHLCGIDSYYIKNSFKRVRLSEVELID